MPSLQVKTRYRVLGRNCPYRARRLTAVAVAYRQSQLMEQKVLVSHRFAQRPPNRWNLVKER